MLTILKPLGRKPRGGVEFLAGSRGRCGSSMPKNKPGWATQSAFQSRVGLESTPWRHLTAALGSADEGALILAFLDSRAFRHRVPSLPHINRLIEGLRELASSRQCYAQYLSCEPLNIAECLQGR